MIVLTVKGKAAIERLRREARAKSGNRGGHATAIDQTEGANRMPIWGAGSIRSNKNTAEGGKAEVHIYVSTEPASHCEPASARARHSAEEERAEARERRAGAETGAERERGKPGLHSELWS